MKCPEKLSKKTKEGEINLIFPSFVGAGNVTRTHDLLITNQLLYRLSYASVMRGPFRPQAVL